MADATTCLAILYSMTGRRASEFKLGAAWAFLKTLHPDEDFLEEIENRFAESVPSGFLLGNTAGTAEPATSHVNVPHALGGGKRSDAGSFDLREECLGGIHGLLIHLK